MLAGFLLAFSPSFVPLPHASARRQALLLARPRASTARYRHPRRSLPVYDLNLSHDIATLSPGYY